MPAGVNAQAAGIPMSDAMGSFKRRKRKSITVTAMLFVVSILILVFGLAATTRTQNITVGGYYPGVILGFGSFLGIIGAHLIENKRQMLVASIVFISFGVVASFCCAIVDGVFAARHIDLRPVYAGRCEYYSSVTAFDLDVHCQTASRVSCNLRVKSKTCYCCDLYNCGKEHPLLGLQNKDVLKKFRKSSMIWNNVDPRGGYHEYTEVQSCQDVVYLYHLLWSATILNIIAFFLGIITAAVLGTFKDMAENIMKAAGFWMHKNRSKCTIQSFKRNCGRFSKMLSKTYHPNFLRKLNCDGDVFFKIALYSTFLI
ncbi:transmembrane protein 255A isoform X4 [Pangasianodon hypophthalmus]|uniref:transmembrane protein 255A isoform X4 n=1 Tax=Pangasianodon hypophthalmus TaxID=310915 RepID=UPI00230715CD|nr:transmembrane protein 255A isoform X4 [Pangasianodon hypophthalmus]